MTRPPDLTDRTALARNRARAGRSPVTFLHEAAAADLQERLAEVNRRFTRPALVTAFPDPWRAVLPQAQVVPDDETLALAPGAHDLVVHALALHWAADPVGQLVQCRRALQPDGLLVAVLFGGRSLQELRAALAQAEVALTGGLSPRVVPMGEIRDLGALMQRAGLALPVADSSLQRVSHAGARALMHDLRGMGEANALAARHRRCPPRALFDETARLLDRDAPDPDRPGRILTTVELIWLTGWAPAPQQPKPLRPGSAAARLADALGTAEIALPAATTDRPDD